MRLAFVTPMRPLDHPRVSGDVIIAQEIFDYFRHRGHDLPVRGAFCTERIPWKPWRWPALALAAWRFLRQCRRERVDAVFTYHAYYRAPDLLGWLASWRGIPRFVFAPAHATKRRKHWRTWPGYWLNVFSLRRADLCFVNKRVQLPHLLRLLPGERVRFVPPGLRLEDFPPPDDLADARHRLRARWGAGERPVVLTTAMLRPGSKSEGVAVTLRTLGRLAREGIDFLYVVVGDGPERSTLEALASEELGLAPGRVMFLGLLPRRDLPEVYAAADLFAFPGIREGLGMVYLEAQWLGLPVVAWDEDGAPQVVRHGVSGLITPAWDEDAYAAALRELLQNAPRRQALGRSAREYVRTEHDLVRNYLAMETAMRERLRPATSRRRNHP